MCCEDIHIAWKNLLFTVVSFLSNSWPLVYPLMVDFSDGYSCYSCSCSSCSCSDRWETRSSPSLSLRLEFWQQYVFLSKHHLALQRFSWVWGDSYFTQPPLDIWFGIVKGPNKTWTLNFLGPKIRFTKGYEIAYNFQGCCKQKIRLVREANILLRVWNFLMVARQKIMRHPQGFQVASMLRASSKCLPFVRYGSLAVVSRH